MHKKQIANENVMNVTFNFFHFFVENLFQYSANFFVK